jgi:hypothetical protein
VSGGDVSVAVAVFVAVGVLVSLIVGMIMSVTVAVGLASHPYGIITGADASGVDRGLAVRLQAVVAISNINPATAR